MEYLDVVISFAALAALCLFLYVRCDLPASLTPLAAVSGTMVWFSIAGMAGLLRPMGWAWFVLAAAAGAAGLWKTSPKKLAGLLRPGFCLFVGLGVVFGVYLALRQPVVAVWDEMSFWGTAAKITKLDNELYTTSSLSRIWEWTATQKPGMILLGYFVQFFGAGFAAWKLYFAYDLLLFACFAAVVGALEGRRWPVWIPAALAAFLSPWFFTIYQRETTVRPVYMDSYGDIPAGVLAAGAVAFWLCLRRTGGKGLWAMPLVLWAASYVKDNTLPIALMAWGLVAFDAFFFGLPGTEPDKKALRFGRRAGFCALALAGPAVGYMAWSRHAAAAVLARAEQGGMGSTSMSLGAVLKNGLGMLLAPGSLPADITEKYGAKFAQVSADMTSAFLRVSITMAGPCVTALVFIAGVFGAAALFGRKGARLRAALLGGITVAGFFAYYLVILFSYVFIFKDFQAASLDSYNRYIFPYLLFAFLVGLTLLADAADAPRRFAPGQGVLLAVSGLMLWRFTSMMLPQFTVLGYPDAYFEEVKQSAAVAQSVVDTVDRESRVFYVYQGDNGEHWFGQSYNLLPVMLDPSGVVNEEKGWSGGSGGTFGLAELANGDPYYHPYTPAQLSSYLAESGCGYMLVEHCDDIFVQSYAEMFTDGLAAAADGPALYAVEITDSGAVMTPVEMEGAA